jgi:hypothetical protein
MILTSEHDNVWEVGIVDMSINSEKSLEYDFDNLCEIFRKSNALILVKYYLPTVDGNMVSLFN